LLKIKNENLYNRNGLIGGSMALDIKGLYPSLRCDTDEDHLQEALALGVVDAGAQIENLSDADFVILSVPVDVALTLLPKVLDVGENSIVLR
jgi:prephenate dehydrogenase